MKKLLVVFAAYCISLPIFAQDNFLLSQFNQTGAKFNCTALSPDGKYLAAGSHVVKVWETATGRELYTFYGHREGVRALHFTYLCNNHEILYLVTAGGYDAKNNLFVWNMQTGKRDAAIEKQEEKILEGLPAINAMHTQHSALIVGGLDGSVKYLDLSKQGVFATHKIADAKTNFIQDVRLSENTHRDIRTNTYFPWIAVAQGNLQTREGGLCIYHAFSTDQVFDAEKTGTFYHAITATDFNPTQDRHVAACGEDGLLKIWDIELGKIYRDFSETNTQLTKVRFSPDGKLLATCNRKGQIIIRDAETGAKMQTFTGHSKAVSDIVFSADGRTLASASEDGSVRLWRIGVYTKWVERYVQEKIKVWQQKDKFERTTDYQKRVNELTFNQKAIEFSQEAINQLAVQTIHWEDLQGEYDADNESFKLQFKGFAPFYLKVPLPEAKIFDQNLHRLQFGQANFTLTPQDEFGLLHLKIQNPATGKTYLYDSQDLTAFNPSQLQLDFATNTLLTTATPVGNENKVFSEIDYQLPKTAMANEDAIAVVIGNKDYRKTKSVDFALNDARSIKNYLTQVMGYKTANILYFENATLTDFTMLFGDKTNAKGKLYNLVKPNRSDVFVFYSGHGAPGLNDQKAYFVPVECDPQYVELTGYSTDVFYDNLAQIPARSMVVALDACFSGENIYKNISPIVIKSKGALGLKNGALLASSANNQVSTWYNEKGHGLFTYYFLKAIHNQNADYDRDKRLTLEEIYQYMNDSAEGIPYQARRLHNIIQTPQLKGQNQQKVLVTY